jgi:hypothetical protein
VLEHELMKKPTEKANVYDFTMIYFELLTNKISFEDSHR